MFYKGDDGLSKDYNLREDVCQPGMYCAALYYNTWHRAILTKLNFSKQKFSVCYIDYGTIAQLPQREIRLLDVRFAKLPSQAFKCRLSGVKPRYGEQKWPVETCEMLLKIGNKAGYVGLLAKIEKTIELENLHIVKLHDTASNDLPLGIIINEFLVEQGYADVDRTELLPIDPYAKMTQDGEPISFVEPPPIRTPYSIEHVKKIITPNASEDKSLHVKPSASEKKSENLKPSPEKECDDVKSKKIISVKTFTLSSYSDSFHVIIWEEKAYMTSTEISELVPKWNKKDLLVKMLKLKKFKSDDIFVHPNENQELFEQCIM